ncbi:T9SS type A sorting domain-containing protein [Rufibacter roseus]|uniref:T9SS type A sorting domain-containing protein n=1 Tax=Rufibacter roseus TaxID=1567108 RepID=A0ABW2DL66_9BACT|nr:T9SS type A sorting domain-containing protein [Rufibacter roseus]
MKIFTRVLLGFLSISLVFGSQAASFGVVPGTIPAGSRTADSSKGDSVLVNWRTGATLTITDFGISSALQLPSYNPNAKKYSPFLSLNKSNSVLSAKAGIKSVKFNFSGNSKTASVSTFQEQRVLPAPTLNAYPNPSKGLTRISLTALGDDNYKIRISNAIGKVYKVIPISKETANETITVDLSPLPAGIYFYSLLVNEKMVETKRLILQQQ